MWHAQERYLPKQMCILVIWIPLQKVVCHFVGSFLAKKATIMYLTPQKSLYLHSRIFLEGPKKVYCPRIRSHVSFLLRSGKLGTKKIHT